MIMHSGKGSLDARCLWHYLGTLCSISQPASRSARNLGRGQVHCARVGCPSQAYVRSTSVPQAVHGLCVSQTTRESGPVYPRSAVSVAVLFCRSRVDFLSGSCKPESGSFIRHNLDLLGQKYSSACRVCLKQIEMPPSLDDQPRVSTSLVSKPPARQMAHRQLPR